MLSARLASVWSEGWLTGVWHCNRNTVFFNEIQYLHFVKMTVNFCVFFLLNCKGAFKYYVSMFSRILAQRCQRNTWIEGNLLYDQFMSPLVSCFTLVLWFLFMWSYSIQDCPPLKFVFHLGVLSMQDCLPSKPSFIQGSVFTLLLSGYSCLVRIF